MASCRVADGKAVAAEVRNRVGAELTKLKEIHPNFQPQLSIVQVREKKLHAQTYKFCHKSAAGKLA